MRTLRLPLAALAALTLASAAAARAQGAQQPAGFREEFLQQFNASMSKLVELAEALPADKYSFRQAPGVMPVGQIFAHIARFNYHYPATAMGIPAPAGINPDTLEQVAEKAKVVALLRRSADHVRQQVRAMPESQLARQTTLYGRQVPQWSVLLQLIAHMNDHMGQSIAYARMAGTAPPWSQ